jgi:hypothetical protein
MIMVDSRRFKESIEKIELSKMERPEAAFRTAMEILGTVPIEVHVPFVEIALKDRVGYESMRLWWLLFESRVMTALDYAGLIGPPKEIVDQVEMRNREKLPRRPGEDVPFVRIKWAGPQNRPEYTWYPSIYDAPEVMDTTDEDWAVETLQRILISREKAAHAAIRLAAACAQLGKDAGVSEEEVLELQRSLLASAPTPGLNRSES